MQLNEQSNIADIAAAFNKLKGTDTDVKTLAKRGKAKLLAQIEAMAAEAAAAEKSKAEEAKPVEDAKPVDSISHLIKQMGTKDAAPAKPKAERKPKAEKVKKEKGPVIRVVAEALLLEVVSHDDDKRPYGHSYDEVLNRIHQQFEGAKTTVACLRWYAVHMRERGEKVPNRPRATPTTTTKSE